MASSAPLGVALCAALNLDPLHVRALTIHIAPGEPLRVLVDWMVGTADENTLGVGFDLFEYDVRSKD